MKFDPTPSLIHDALHDARSRLVQALCELAVNQESQHIAGGEEKAMAAMAAADAAFSILLQERLDMPELVWKRFIDLEVLH